MIARLAPMLFAAALLLTSPTRADDVPRPSADHKPAEVVAFVVDALQRNPSTEDDEGIKTVWSFASPNNRAVTGPLERFTAMIKGGFSDMLGFNGSRFDDIEVNGDTAVQVVWLLQQDGRELGYAFQMGRQSNGEFKGMWMTEGVVPLGESERSGTRI